jgi:nucleoside-diphosphate-sugar epimerase
MRLLLVGGNASLAPPVRRSLPSSVEIITAGRSGCDLPLDLAWDEDRIRLPDAIDVVVCLAADFGGTSFEAMANAVHVNVMGTLKLCRACTRAAAGHLVLVSSVFATLGEDSPFFGIYALSKRQADEVAQLYGARFGLPLTIIRLPRIYGAGAASRRHQPFLYTLIDKARNNEDIVLYGSNDAERNLLHAEDAGEIIARTAEQRPAGLYSCPNPVNVRMSEIARAAVAAFGSTSRIRFDPDRPDIADNGSAPDDRLFRRIGFYPRVSLAAGMAKEAARRGATT